MTPRHALVHSVMRTDSHFNKIVSAYPKEFFELFGLRDPGPCQVTSVAVKEISRTLDGLVEPLDNSEPLRILEFQMQSTPHILQRAGIECGCLEITHHPRPVEAYVIFGSASLDPGPSRWKKIVKVLYLDKAVKALEKRQPGHWLVALFRPLLERKNEIVEKFAQQDYAVLQKLGSSQPGTLPIAAIFLDWLVQRFKSLNSTQIAQMIAQLTPIEQTVLGMELIGKGRQEGREEGREEGMERILLKLLTKRFGKLPPKCVEGLKGLSVAKLETLAEDQLAMKTLVELQSWIVKHSKRRK